MSTTSDDLAVVDAEGVRRRSGEGLAGVRWAACASMFGVLVISVAYTLGRQNVSGAVGVFWLGQLIVFVPPFAVVARRTPIPAAAARALVVLISVETYLIKWLYSPFQSKFFDELQHVSTIPLVLQQGKVPVTNISIPITRDFPGLQSVSGSFAALTSAPASAVALILGGAFHIAIGLTAFCVFRATLGTTRRAVLAFFVYATNPYFEVFNSYFVYENLALPFALAGLYFALRLRRAESPRPSVDAVLGYTCFMAMLVSHHVTAIFGSVVFLLMLIENLVRRGLRRRGQLTALLIVSLVSAGLYFARFHTVVFNYFRPSTVQALKPGQAPTIFPSLKVASSYQSQPYFDRVVAYGGYILLSVAVVVGLIRFRRIALARLSAFAALALLFLVSLPAGRLLPFGAQIFGRLTSYLYVGVAVFSALILILCIRRLRRSVVLWVAFALVLCGGLATAVPAYWHRVPGHYYVKGFESGVDAHELDAAKWALLHLGSHRVFMTDGNGSVVLGTLSQEKVEHAADQLYYATSLDDHVIRLFRRFAIQYVWVDRRFATGTSPSSRYFYGPSNGYFTRPPTLAQLNRFRSSPVFQCLYDDGDIRIYRLLKVNK